MTPPMLYNPYTGNRRNDKDIISDPEGLLIHVPETTLESCLLAPPEWMPKQGEWILTSDNSKYWRVDRLLRKTNSEKYPWECEYSLHRYAKPFPLQVERDRFLVLATKHCPQMHHDWTEIINIIHKK